MAAEAEIPQLPIPGPSQELCLPSHPPSLALELGIIMAKKGDPFCPQTLGVSHHLMC